MGVRGPDPVLGQRAGRAHRLAARRAGARRRSRRWPRSYDHREGRTWRSLADTTNQPIISARAPQAWRSWQRGEDYYSEGELIWLDADTLIREKSGGKKSLDDFARAFFGVEDGRIKVLPYTFEDVVAALNAVQPHDWARLPARARRRPRRPSAPLDGLARGGWKLVYTDKPNACRDGRGSAARRGGTDLSLLAGHDAGQRQQDRRRAVEQRRRSRPGSRRA